LQPFRELREDRQDVEVNTENLRGVPHRQRELPKMPTRTTRTNGYIPASHTAHCCGIQISLPGKCVLVKGY
jgi:hypothetical protein